MKSRLCRIGCVLLLAVSLLGSAVAGSGMAVAGEPAVPRVSMPLMSAPPTIDGLIDEEEWKHAVRNVGLVSHATGVLCPREAVFWVGSDGSDVYVAIQTEAPPDGRLVTRAVPDAAGDLRAAFLDDSIELVLDPKRDRSGGDRSYYHLITNARGALFDWAVDPGNRQNPMSLNWRVPDWQMRERVVDGWWHVEIAVPVSSLGATKEDCHGTWGMRVARNWRRPFEQSQWAGGSPSYDDRATMPLVRWDDAAPVVRVLSLHQDRERPRIEVAVFNPHDEPAAVDVVLSDAWHRDPPRELRQGVTVPAGEQTVLALDSRDGGPEGLHRTEIRVTSPDGERVYYQRRFSWSMHPAEDRWTIGEEQKRAVDLQLKVYPYRRKVRFRASVEALAVRDRIAGAEARIAAADEEGRPVGEPLWREPIAFEAYVAEGIYDVPDLPDGKYVFLLRLEGGDGVPEEPVAQPFVRRAFPWEHNTLGISDEVMPPFEPLRVDGRSVGAVLRRHVHGPGGLWSEVTSDGEPLLAAPMGWEVVATDATGQAESRPVVGDGWQARSAKATSVLGGADWTAGPVRANVATEYDYDGMMLVALTLEPTGEASLDRLTLNVPLRNDLARYLHAVGDGLRHNYAGFTPPGEGPIWDSSRASKLEIPGTFYPYLWLGDGERGLSWFADTDRDWVLDDETPTLELVRQGETLLLRVHFVTRPGPLRRRHRIVFGLQATPTKPMPEGWRRWTGLKNVAGSRPVRWMGATFYWGGIDHDVYPYKHRFDYFDKLREARETGEPDRQFIADWLAMVDRELAPKGSERYKFFEAHVNAGFHAARSSPWSEGFRLFGYTNPRGVGFHGPEFATFQDEWLRYGWFNRNWGSDEGVAYDVSPSRSFQDYALWHYREMLRSFDGVYWDNMFLSAHFDPVVGEAWTDDQGRVHPTLGLFHLRELAKRTAVMLWQETKDLPEGRKPPVTLSHMTNTMIVPVHSFLNCTMDWEWKYGYEDFQDRFSPDLTVAETIGRQVGAWPTILAGGHPDAKDPRVDFMYRTRLGVALVHEIQVFDYRPERDLEIYGKLFDFGYGSDRCKVFNYWHAGHPVRVEGIDARTLALAHSGEAIVVVTDYGDGGRARVTLDLKTLGLEAGAQAADFETSEPVERSGPGAFAFDLKKHDFRILHVK